MLVTFAARCLSAALALTLIAFPIAAQTQRSLPNADPSPSVIIEPTGPLTLAIALGLALARNPELIGYDWEIRGAEARYLQAGLLPNPELGITTEDFGGRGDLRGFRGAESTIQLGQLIELGGKRAKRLSSAGYERDLARQDYESKRLDILAETSQAFIDLLAAQRRLEFIEETYQIGDRTLKAVLERIRAGRASPLEEDKARVAQSTIRLELGKARRTVDGARKRLAAMWASSTPTFSRAEGRLDELVSVPALDELRTQAAQNPDLARWRTEIQLREANIALEQSKSIPDLTVSAGVKRFEETDDSAFLVGISIPLPVFNRNQGGVMEAGSKLSRAYEDRRAVQSRVDADLATAHNALVIAENELMALRTEVIPGAQRSFDAAQQAYRLGRSGFLDVLDAQRTLLEARAQEIDALADYQRAVVDIERLTGQPLRAATNSER